MSLYAIHVIKSHAVSNLNRDEFGTPKTMLYGGVERGRRSSQNVKFTIRHSDYYKNLLENEAMGNMRNVLAIRTRDVSSAIKQHLWDEFTNAVPDEEFEQVILQGLDSTKEEEARFYALSEIKSAIDILGDYMKTVTEENREAKLKELADKTAPLLKAEAEEDAEKEAGKTKKSKGRKAGKAQNNNEEKAPNCFSDLLKKVYGTGMAFDIAMMGRMVANDGDKRVDGAMYVAHSISTHAIRLESDFFTLFDECAPGSGSAHMNNAEYDAPCLYECVMINGDELLANLSCEHVDAEIVPAAVKAVTQAFALETSRSKQNSMASRPYPSVVLVEKYDVSNGFTHAGAFEKPVKAGEDGIAYASAVAYKNYLEKIARVYDTITPERYWLSFDGVEVDESVAHNCKSMSELLACIK